MLFRSTVFVLASMLPLAAANDPVRIDTGMVSGVDGAEAGVRVYKGIPFAAPPVGDLRWKGPRPAAKWEGVRAGDEFGPVCMQRTPRGNSKMGEDCLYLNVYTAA